MAAYRMIVRNSQDPPMVHEYHLVEADTLREARNVLLSAGLSVVIGFKVGDMDKLYRHQYQYVWHKMADGARIVMAVQEGT